MSAYYYIAAPFAAVFLISLVIGWAFAADQYKDHKDPFQLWGMLFLTLSILSIAYGVYRLLN
jgi:FtsH-binding integral membrane protein